MRTVVERLLVVAVIAAYPLFAFYPFHFELPEHVENGAARAADGTLVFARQGLFETAAAPAWIKPAIAENRFSIILEVVPGHQPRRRTAPILAVSRDGYRSNLVVGQHGNKLEIRLRTTGTGLHGQDTFTVPKAFEAGRRTHINLRVFPAGGRARLELRVDGIKKLSHRLDGDALATWNPRYRVALGNEMSGNRPWLGAIHRATVRAGPVVVDYTAPGAVERPARYWKVANDPDFKPYDPEELRDVLINLIGFMPLGMLVAVALRRRRGRIGLTPALVSLAVSFFLETAQFLIPGRTPSLSDLMFDTLGGLLGAALVAAVFGLRSHSFRLRRLESDPVQTVE